MSHDLSVQQAEEDEDLNLSQTSVLLTQIIALVEYVCLHLSHDVPEHCK